MTDEERARDLLILAAELPDSVQPPIQRLLEQGRARRARRAVLSLLAVTTAVAAAIIVPLVIVSPGGRPSPRTSAPPLALPSASGPTAAQISRFHWSELPPSPLGPRSQPLLTWTGKELIELGGAALKGSTTNDGAAFDIATGRWHRIAQVQGNVGFTNAVTAWTGRELFVTNGQTAPCAPGAPVTPCLPHAGLYDPTTNRWMTTLLPRQMEGLTPMVAVWTGRDVVVGFVGTAGNSGELGVVAYDPATNHWQVITPALRPGHPCRSISMVATSNRVILWSLWDRVHHYKNGASDHAGVDVLARSPNGTWRDVTDHWPQNHNVTSPVFTGSAILISPGQIWCGTMCQQPYSWGPGYFVDPTTLRRTALPLGPLGQANPAFAWTGRAIIAVNLYADIRGPGTLLRPDDMALYNPQTRQWRRLRALPRYPVLAGAPIWADTELLALTDSGQLWSFRG